LENLQKVINPSLIAARTKPRTYNVPRVAADVLVVDGTGSHRLKTRRRKTAAIDAHELETENQTAVA